MGLAEAHNNRRGKVLRMALGIISAPCGAFYLAGTGKAGNCSPGCSLSSHRKGVLRRRGMSVIVPAEVPVRAGLNLWDRSS